jgi:MoxR-like ATPase
MEERRVTVEGTPRDLPSPFLVVATQNPVEYEGTYPLPEAQLDRFLFKLIIGYPSAQEEHTVLTRHDTGMNPHDVRASGVKAVAGPADLAAARQEIDAIRTDPAVLGYIVQLATASRQSPSLTLGVSPRGSTMLLKAAKAWAWLNGRGYVTPDDVKAMALPALRHRVQVRPDVELEGGDADTVLQGILAAVGVPR